MRYLKWTGPAVAACAALGTLGTKPQSPWYLGLKKPSWQPPAWLFAPAWTTIYSLTAVASARTLERLPTDEDRRTYAVALGTNLALNTAFTWVYFVGEHLKTSVAIQAALELSTLDLIRRSAKVDPPAALMLSPYAAWGAFALALNAEIARQN